MAILTAEEVADILGYDSSEDMPGDVMGVWVPAANEFIKTATGRDWGADAEVDPLAKACAGVLLEGYFESREPDQMALWMVGMLEAKARELS